MMVLVAAIYLSWAVVPNGLFSSVRIMQVGVTFRSRVISNMAHLMDGLNADLSIEIPIPLFNDWLERHMTSKVFSNFY